MLTGAAWLRYSGGFSAAGSGWRLIARYIFGLAGILVIWFGLDQVFPDGEMLLALSLRYVRYMLVGLWVSGAAPWLFMRFGWAVSPQGRRISPAGNGKLIYNHARELAVKEMA